MITINYDNGNYKDFKFLGKVGVQGAETLPFKEGFPPPAKLFLKN